MKKFLLACVVAIGGFTFPLAANNPYNCCPELFNPFFSCSDFAGFYMGGNFGAFSHVAYLNDLDGFFTSNASSASIDTSFTAGLQFGYDWLFNNFLVGIVGDWNWVDTHHKIPDDPNGTAGENFHRHQLEWFSTVRARCGVTVHDALFYITGGAVAVRRDNRLRGEVLGAGDTTGIFSDKGALWGWTSGAGVELMLGCNWSLGAEVLLLHFSHYGQTFVGDNGANLAFQFSNSGYLGRILLNYRMGNLFSWCCW